MTDLARHAQEVTESLREEEPPLNLDLREAVCPRCSQAYFVAAGGYDALCDWNVCPDCFHEAIVHLEPVPTD